MTEPASAPAPRIAPLPMFLIAEKPDGRLAIRQVCSSCGQALMSRFRQDGRYRRVWLAHAFQQVAGGAA